jgi:hypothetical protein
LKTVNVGFTGNIVRGSHREQVLFVEYDHDIPFALLPVMFAGFPGIFQPTGVGLYPRNLGIMIFI